MRARHHLCIVGLSALVLLLAASGCADDGDAQVIAPVVLGMVETAAPTYDDGEEQIYETFTPVTLPLRRPSDDERPKGQQDPYPRPPFHLASDTRTTVRFTLSNLEDKPHTVELLLNPWNEFVHYEPGVIVTDEETLPNFSGIDRFFVLPPFARVEGIITADDIVELATDLATAMQIAKTPPDAAGQFAGPALYNRAFNQQNRSSQTDPVLAPFIPKVVANVVGFDLGLRSYDPAKVAVEVVLDIEDVQGDRVIPDGDDTRRQGKPGTALVPPPPPDG
ncbi:MAG: hypothetical protein JWP97_627 [Labilithrix sp.]|nr:hypothetical protein [Labilithrix sp.]